MYVECRIVLGNHDRRHGHMARSSFLTNHSRALICIAGDAGVRLRDIAAALDITEGSAYAIVTDLVEAGYMVKDKDGRRNRYRIQAHLSLHESLCPERTVAEVLDLLVDKASRRQRTGAKNPVLRASTRARQS